MFISASYDQEIKVWVGDGFTKNNKSIHTFSQHTTPVKCLSIIDDETMIY